MAFNVLYSIVNTHPSKSVYPVFLALGPLYLCLIDAVRTAKKEKFLANDNVLIYHILWEFA